MTAAGWGRRAAGVVFWLLFAIVLAAQLAVVAPEFWTTRLWEDEAFNLTVPLNLLAGHGYSSAGLLGSGMLTPFDVRISTGPVVLVPVAAVLATGIDPVVGGRLVSLLFYAGLLAALWMLGRRIAGRWGALIAVVVPLALNTNQLPSPVQGPVDILGELPAAALIAWSIVFVRRRPWLAGLFLGLAIQTKFISLLAAPALLVYVWFLTAGEPWRARLKRCVWLTVWAVVPTASYWLVVLISLGPAGLVSNAHQFLAFLKTGGQTASVPPDQKLGALTNSWFVEGWAVIAVLVAAVVIGTLAILAMRSPARRGASADESVKDAGAQAAARDVALLLIAAGVNLLAWVGWWTLSQGTPTWIRYPATGLVVSIPMLAAAAVLGVRLLWVRIPRRERVETASRAVGFRQAQPADGRQRWIVAGVAALACAAIVVSTGVSVQRHAVAAQVPDYGETLSQQRDVARQLAALGDEKFATPWGSQLGAILLSGVQFTNLTGPNARSLPTVLWSPELSGPGQAAFDGLISSACKRDVVRVAAQYAVCRVR
ncbi:hypothetical protein GCM10028798_14180 [Humibacter antri]